MVVRNSNLLWEIHESLPDQLVSRFSCFFLHNSSFLRKENES